VQRDRFENILDAQIKRVQDVLVAKAAEYANEDVLANFKKAAHLRGVGLPQAVLGMMVKHTVSVFDMVESGKPFDLDLWDEKITDHINYLILIRAALVENAELSEVDEVDTANVQTFGA
jgi:hypothetical protein